MKFKNLNPIDYTPQIEIIRDGAVWDLHNSADFLGHEYDSTQNILKLSWDYGCNCDAIIGGKISLNLLGVKDLRISEKDNDVPRSEDSCLDNIRLKNEGTINIVFRGGQSFEVQCDEVEFNSGQTTGHMA